MSTYSLVIHTNGEKFYDITEKVKTAHNQLNPSGNDGILYLFISHTSCALTISESYDPTAKEDMEQFLKHLAPTNLKFIKHTAEGTDDSPSHMKSILLNQDMNLIVEDGEIILGTWQGIYLCEFRKANMERKVLLKFMKG